MISVLNFLHPLSRKKIDSLRTQFSLYQTITNPIHFTKHSSSLIDLILISNKDYLVLSDVGDPFLHQGLRYYCPVFGILKLVKPKLKSFTRHIWNYNNGDYDKLLGMASSYDLDSLKDNNIDTYANITSTILSLASQCIPNKNVKIKQSDPPWLTSHIKRFHSQTEKSL